MFKDFLRRNDVGVGSVFAFLVVPFVAALVAALGQVDVWSLTPDQLWALAKASFISVLVGVAGRYTQAAAVKWGSARVIAPREDDVVVDGDDFPIEAPEGLV